MENLDKELGSQNPSSTSPNPSSESNLNKFCRENKDLLNVGSRAGIYIALMLIVYLYSKTAIMSQINWAEENCPCMDWGGDAFTLTNQPKATSTSNISLILPGETNDGATTGG